jgi:hypothetical protein
MIYPYQKQVAWELEVHLKGNSPWSVVAASADFEIGKAIYELQVTWLLTYLLKQQKLEIGLPTNNVTMSVE